MGLFLKTPLIAWVIAFTSGIGGDGEPWVRLGATLAHSGTACLLYGIGSTPFPSTQLKTHVGVWSALTYLTLPAVSVSSIIVSTDAFLLFFWALALLSVVKIMDGASGWWWGALGIGLGFGLLPSMQWLFCHFTGYPWAMVTAVALSYEALAVLGSDLGGGWLSVPQISGGTSHMVWSAIGIQVPML